MGAEVGSVGSGARRAAVGGGVNLQRAVMVEGIQSRVQGTGGLTGFGRAAGGEGDGCQQWEPPQVRSPALC